MTEQTRTSENPAELFRSESPAILEVSFCRRVPSPPASITAHASRWISFENLSTDVGHANVFPNVVAGDSTILTRIVTSFSDTPRDFRECRVESSKHRRHQTHQIFHHLHLFRQSHRRPLCFFQEVRAGTKFALSAQAARLL